MATTLKSEIHITFACFLDFVGDPLDVDIPILRNYLRDDLVYLNSGAVYLLVIFAFV